MMNYIWAGLILVSIVFAVGNDLHDEYDDVYENNKIYDLRVDAAENFVPENGGSARFRLTHCNVLFDGEFSVAKDKIQIEVGYSESLPQQWRNRFVIEDGTTDSESISIDVVEISKNNLRVRLPPVRLQRLGKMMQAGFDMAEFAAKLALGLIGLMALWLGLMKIAEDSGLVNKLVRLLRPVLRPLFPEVPPDHPAMGAISMNLSANMLGLGNAATPMGIKAMQHLQDLNTKKESASDSMCMFLALNTSSVQLLPPVTVIALLGVNAGGLFVSIFLATLCSTLVAVFAARWFARRNPVAT